MIGQNEQVQQGRDEPVVVKRGKDREIAMEHYYNAEMLTMQCSVRGRGATSATGHVELHSTLTHHSFQLLVRNQRIGTGAEGLLPIRP